MDGEPGGDRREVMIFCGICGDEIGEVDEAPKDDEQVMCELCFLDTSLTEQLRIH